MRALGNRTQKTLSDVTAQGLLLDLGLTQHCNTQGQSLGLWVFSCVLLCLYGSLSCFTLRNISSKLKWEPVLKSYLPPLIILQFFQSIDFRALWTSFFSCCLSWQTVLLSLLLSIFLLGSYPDLFHLIMTWLRSDSPWENFTFLLWSHCLTLITSILYFIIEHFAFVFCFISVTFLPNMA